MPSGTRRGWSVAVASAVAIGGDLLAHRLVRARPIARYGSALVVLAIARAHGRSWSELGLGRSGLGHGIRLGAAAGGCAAAAVLGCAVVPATRRFFLDERARPVADGTGLGAGLARITLAAVPPEELTYRSALPALMPDHWPPPVAVAWSSLLFGVSHVSPTLITMSQSAFHPHVAESRRRRAGFVLANVAVTGGAGAIFCWLRRRSGNVLTPLVAHVVVNDAALVAGRIAHELAVR